MVAGRDGVVPRRRAQTPVGQGEAIIEVGRELEEIAERCDFPLSALQVTALLESVGITDGIAEQRYGYGDVFELAEALRFKERFIELS